MCQEYWKNIFVLYLKPFTPKYLPSVYMYKTLLFAQELPNGLKSKTKANKSRTGYLSPGRTAGALIQFTMDLRFCSRSRQGPLCPVPGFGVAPLCALLSPSAH